MNGHWYALWQSHNYIFDAVISTFGVFTATVYWKCIICKVCNGLTINYPLAAMSGSYSKILVNLSGS